MNFERSLEDIGEGASLADETTWNDLTQEQRVATLRLAFTYPASRAFEEARQDSYQSGYSDAELEITGTTSSYDDGVVEGKIIGRQELQLEIRKLLGLKVGL